MCALHFMVNRLFCAVIVMTRKWKVLNPSISRLIRYAIYEWFCLLLVIVVLVARKIWVVSRS